MKTITEGTSQGLFVVVAIVIFGIFVGLSYTLFGSEGLTKNIKGIFETATEQSLNSLEGYTKGKTEDLTKEIVGQEQIVIDSMWKNTATGLLVTSKFGRTGIPNKDGVFVFNKEETIGGVGYTSVGIDDIYIQTLESKPFTYEITKMVFSVDGKQVDGRLEKRYQSGYIRYFYFVNEPYAMEKDRVYTLQITVFTDAKEYYVLSERVLYN